MNCLPLLLFGPAAYYKAIIDAKMPVFEIWEHFPKQTLRNRIIVLKSNGNQILSVPLKKRSSKTPYADIRISYDVNWPLFFSKSLQTTYGNSPFYWYYKDDLIQLFEAKHKYLYQLNQKCLQWSFEMLQINQPITLTSNYIGTTEENFNSNSKPYYQVFSDKYGFVPHLSILDLLFMKGPETNVFLQDY